MSSNIPLKVFGRAAQAFIAQKRAEQRNKPITTAQALAISVRTKKGTRDSATRAEQFINICAKAGLPKPELEFQFHPVRKWRFDVAFPAQKLAIEIQGGAFIKGRHNAPVSFVKEMEKANSAAILGWRILYRTPANFLDYETVELVQRAMRGTRLL